MHSSFVEQQKGTFPFSTVGGGGGNVISLFYAKINQNIATHFHRLLNLIFVNIC